MIALSITALIAGAISGMMAAVSVGVNSSRDNRSTMVAANSAAARLDAYIAPARCLLTATDSDLVLWLNDRRESETVHATELRWLIYDNVKGTLDVWYVDFPAGWSQAACDLADLEYDTGTNWDDVLTYYLTQGWISSLTIIDGLANLSVTLDQPVVTDARHAWFAMEFTTTQGTMTICASATLRLHRTPTS
jgi:hypothetical protein